jgi:5-methylcytosine-specific restriction endonuclease McrA
MRNDMKVTVINDDYTLRACECKISQQLSDSPDGPITHYAVGWCDDFLSEDSWNIHIVPAKNVLFERGCFEEDKKELTKPEVIVYRLPISEQLRNEVYDRDGRRCAECGSTENLVIDHIYPFSKGGKTELDNLQTLCKSCNSKKGAKVYGG